MQAYASKIRNVHQDLIDGELQSAHASINRTDITCRDWEFRHLAYLVNKQSQYRKQPAGIGCLAVSEDGATFATGGTDGKIRIWDRNTLEILFLLPGHHGAIKAIAFDRSGKFLVSGGIDGNVIYWELDSQKEIARHSLQPLAIERINDSLLADERNRNTLFKEFEEWMFKIVDEFGKEFDKSLSVAAIFEKLPVYKILYERLPANRRLASIIIDSFESIAPRDLLIESKDTKSVLIGAKAVAITRWDLTTGKTANIPGGNYVNFSRNGFWCASTIQRTTTVKHFQDKTKKFKCENPGRVFAHAFSNNTETLACAGDYITIWDLATGEMIGQVKSPVFTLTTVMFSKDDSQVIAGSNDGYLVIWNWDNDDLRTQRIGGSVNSVSAVNGSLDTVVCSDPDGHVIVSNIGHLDTSLTLESGSKFGYGSKSNQIVSNTEKKLILRDADTLEIQKEIVGNFSSLKKIFFSSNEKYICTINYSNVVSIHQIDDAIEVKQIDLGNTTGIDADFSIQNAACDDQSGLIYFACRDGRVKSLNILSGQIVDNFRADNGWINQMQFLPKENLLMIAGGTEGITFWGNEKTHASANRLSQFYGHMGDVLVEPGEIIFASEGGGIEIVDRGKGKSINAFKHPGYATSIRLSNNKNRLFTASGKSVFIWDINTGTLLHSFACPFDRIDSIFVTKGGTIGAIRDKKLCLFASEYDTNVGYVDDHFRDIWTIGLVGDQHIITGSEDRRIKLRDPASGQTKTTFSMDSGIRAVLATNSVDRLLGADRDGRLVLWDLNSKQKIAESADNTHLILNSASLSSPRNEILVGGHKRSVVCLDANTLAEKYELQTEHEVRSVTQSKDGNTIFAGTNDGLYVWSLPNQELVSKLTEFYNITQVASTNDDLLFILHQQKLSVVDSRTLKTVQHLNIGSIAVHCFDVSSANNVLAIAVENKIQLRRASDFSLLDSIFVDGKVKTIKISNDGTKIYAGIGSSLVIWDRAKVQ